MTREPDRRSYFATARRAHVSLHGHSALPLAEATPATIARPVADLCASPGGARDRQLLFGQSVEVLETVAGQAFVRGVYDGYVGYVDAAALRQPVAATHRVAVPATHLYPAANLKRRERTWLSFGSELRVVSASGDFFETAEGAFVPKPHLRPLNASFADPVTVAQMHFGVPYLWGGNSAAGIDCSGLVQAGFRAAGLPCPGDSDQQEAALGTPLPDDAAPLRGDLYFWAGHVAIAVDAETLIHANAHAMAVSYEPIAKALDRIAATEGPLTARKRLAA